MPDEIVWRQPPYVQGLAIRGYGRDCRRKLTTARESDAILLKEIVKAGPIVIFAILHCNTGDVRSVGVMGDGRTYDYTIALCLSYSY